MPWCYSQYSGNSPPFAQSTIPVILPFSARMFLGFRSPWVKTMSWWISCDLEARIRISSQKGSVKYLLKPASVLNRSSSRWLSGIRQSKIPPPLELQILCSDILFGIARSSEIYPFKSVTTCFTWSSVIVLKIWPIGLPGTQVMSKYEKREDSKTSIAHGAGISVNCSTMRRVCAST